MSRLLFAGGAGAFIGVIAALVAYAVWPERGEYAAWEAAEREPVEVCHHRYPKGSCPWCDRALFTALPSYGDPRPRPLVDRFGRLYHADACFGDDVFPDHCVCGKDDAEIDAMLIDLEGRM